MEKICRRRSCAVINFCNRKEFIMAALQEPFGDAGTVKIGPFVSDRVNK